MVDCCLYAAELGENLLKIVGMKKVRFDASTMGKMGKYNELIFFASKYALFLPSLEVEVLGNQSWQGQ